MNPGRVVLPSLVVAIRLSGSTCEKQYDDELSDDDTNDMDVVEVDRSPGLLRAGPAQPAHLLRVRTLSALSAGGGGGGTISMTTIRNTASRGVRVRGRTDRMSRQTKTEKRLRCPHDMDGYVYILKNTYRVH